MDISLGRTKQPRRFLVRTFISWASGRCRTGAFSISPNIKYVERVGSEGAKFVMLDQNGAETGSYIYAERVKTQLGIPGFELMKAAAAKNKETK
jgi:hypothetical protein